MMIEALDDGELDTVPCVQAIEREFEISIEDAEAGRLQTLGQLHRLILRKRGLEGSDACLSAAAFYRVRPALMQVFGLARAAIRPSSSLARLVRRPGSQRWQRLAALFGIEERELARSHRVRVAMFSVTMAAAAVAFIIGASPEPDLRRGLGVALLTCPVAWILAVVATVPLRVRAPFATVGDLAQAALAVNFGGFARTRWTAAERDVWDRMVRIVGEEFGVREAGLVPETRFVGDLAMFDRLLAGLGAR